MAETKTTSSDGGRAGSARQKLESMPLGKTPTFAWGIHRATCSATTLLTAVSTTPRAFHENSASLAPSRNEARWSMEWKVIKDGVSLRRAATAPANAAGLTMLACACTRSNRSSRITRSTAPSTPGVQATRAPGASAVRTRCTGTPST